MMVLSQLITSILSQTSGMKAFHRNSKIEAFAYDLALIALSVRTGYLVDTIHVPSGLAESVYCKLLNNLRTMSDHFKDIIHVYDPDSNQSFFINKPLFLVKVKDLFDNENISCYPVFIYLPDNAEPRKLRTVPTPLTEVLRYLLKNLTTNQDSIPEVSLRLPPNLSMVTSIPLAAVLLDYPIAYVPESESQTSFLSGTPLVVYRCRLVGKSQGGEDNDKQHVLLQFSCPVSLENSMVSTRKTVSFLEHTFQPRVAQILSKYVLHVDYEHVAPDRVAL
ncbi:hypothetical protein Agabi119p4_7294 [Agaricus bisporus var. burnettii]|uniref:Uncharacterized protein n=1 Tax=Agaricus bisporus var. burnettii TaxID=192524 RepID=A0A8H7EYW8_AGABI|nr:hypothetical protein Agabi119p4_7294 [Agaricus bisporus var. burnettii]